jgi:hypothetical protein
MELERVPCETELIDVFDLDLAALLDGFQQQLDIHSTVVVVPVDYSDTEIAMPIGLHVRECQLWRSRSFFGHDRV